MTAADFNIKLTLLWSVIPVFPFYHHALNVFVFYRQKSHSTVISLIVLIHIAKYSHLVMSWTQAVMPCFTLEQAIRSSWVYEPLCKKKLGQCKTLWTISKSTEKYVKRYNKTNNSRTPSGSYSWKKEMLTPVLPFSLWGLCYWWFSATSFSWRININGLV